MDATLKAYTLNEVAVNPFTYTQHSNIDDEDVGMQLLFLVLAIDFVIAFALAPIFVIFLTNTFTATLRSNSKSYSSSMITGAGAVSTIFCVMTWIAELHHLHKLVKVDTFIDIKLGYLATLYTWSFLVSLVITLGIRHSENKQYQHIRENSTSEDQPPPLAIRWWIVVYIAGSTIVGFLSHMLLILAPTVIFLFVNPVDVSSLLFLHVAMMYSMTVLLAIFIFQMRQWGHKLQCMIFGPWVDRFTWFLYLLYACCIVAVVPLSYVTIIEIYQFVFGRNLYDQLATTVLATYIPSVAIVLFTWLLNRSFSENDDNTKEKQLMQMIVTELQQVRVIVDRSHGNN